MSAPAVTASAARRLLLVLRQWEEADADPWDALIETAARDISARASGAPEPGDDRLALAAAGLAAYRIALCEAGSGDVGTFRAGDVSITTQGVDNTAGARRLMEECLSGASDLLEDRAFAFLEV